MKNPGGLTLVLLVVLQLAACQSATPERPSVAPATATAAPTNTPIPPTNTPTNTPILPTSTPLPTSSITAALLKTKSATIYRLEMNMTLKAEMENPPPGTPPMQEISLLTIQGELSGKDSHLKLAGFIALFMGADADKGIEILEVGGNKYIHGPVPLLGAKEAKWYVLPPSSSSPTPARDPSEVYDQFVGKDFDPSRLEKAAPETLDRQRCEVYQADKETSLKMFGAFRSDLSTSLRNYDEMIANADAAEVKFWVCDDGYLHQVRMSLEAHEQERPANKFGYLILLHLYDFDAKIAITAPQDAEPAANPFLNFLSTPTPTPQN